MNLLDKAFSLFETNDIDEAFFYFSKLASIEPNNEDYKVYLLICDIAQENLSHGKFLLEYFVILQKEDPSNAIKMVKKAIKEYEINSNSLMFLMKEFSKLSEVNITESIDYEDFLKLIEESSFKDVFERIMFSTKIAISSEEELFDFIDKLVENGFDNIAQDYLETFENTNFISNKKLIQLYEKLNKKEQIATKSKR